MELNPVVYFGNPVVVRPITEPSSERYIRACLAATDLMYFALYCPSRLKSVAERKVEENHLPTIIQVLERKCGEYPKDKVSEIIHLLQVLHRLKYSSN